MMTDPIADMLTRIRNAVRVERPHVDVPLSKVKRGVADVLKREGYIWDWKEFKEAESDPVAQLRVELKCGRARRAHRAKARRSHRRGANSHAGR